MDEYTASIQLLKVVRLSASHINLFDKLLLNPRMPMPTLKSAWTTSKRNDRQYSHAELQSLMQDFHPLTTEDPTIERQDKPAEEFPSLQCLI